jgi:hypothetical protein
MYYVNLIAGCAGLAFLTGAGAVFAQVPLRTTLTKRFLVRYQSFRRCTNQSCDRQKGR